VKVPCLSCYRIWSRHNFLFRIRTLLLNRFLSPDPSKAPVFCCRSFVVRDFSLAMRLTQSRRPALSACAVRPAQRGIHSAWDFSVRQLVLWFARSVFSCRTLLRSFFSPAPVRRSVYRALFCCRVRGLRRTLVLSAC
jgi:hypothetical protein